MQASTMGGAKLEKRYSPSFRDDSTTGNTSRKSSAPKRKRDDALRLVQNKTQNPQTLNHVRMHTHTHLHGLQAFYGSFTMYYYN